MSSLHGLSEHEIMPFSPRINDVVVFSVNLSADRLFSHGGTLHHRKDLSKDGEAQYSTKLSH